MTTFAAAEDHLPRVPLPTLQESCDRFLEWCAPLLTPAELAATEAEVAAFAAGPGPLLHKALAAYDAAPGVHSWLDTFWPYRYLGRRDRIALNANFFFLFQDTGEEQIARAAGLIAGALAYKARVDDGSLEPVVLRGQPQTMVQNRYLFGTTRIPGLERDSVRVAPGRHIVVFHGGEMFRMEVLAEDGTPYDLASLAAGLRVVRAGRGGESVGSLTSMARAEWAAVREELLGHSAAAVEDVETALFCVCLEDFAPAGVQEACDELLYGDRGNRWFDKAVSFVIFADGRAGINIEHCELDGTTILAFTDALLSAEPPSPPSGGVSREVAVAPVSFQVDEGLRAKVRAAAADFAAYGAATATRTVAFADFGAEDAKALGMSPDAFVQLAYQLAHRRAKGLVGATYESIATRQFRHGRTEAMRVVTPEMVAFVDAMMDAGAAAGVRREAARAAAAAHVRRAKECQAGDAPEQHLWELEMIQRRRGPELGVDEQPSLFRSPGWTVMRDDYLSTSSAPSERIQYFGFGSTSSRCIGVAYVLLPERFHVYLSTPQAVAGGMTAFAECLRDAVGELRELLVA
ncbi:choline/carnitine O-acyltransferase [Streptomyces boninensis]|uniref:choline/carnitine O-acyltransferase n=1 Tax=Streptomyces boninensis TaxID=2039455 RepID=UPI003B22669F